MQTCRDLTGEHRLTEAQLSKVLRIHEWPDRSAFISSVDEALLSLSAHQAEVLGSAISSIVSLSGKRSDEQLSSQVYVREKLQTITED